MFSIPFMPASSKPMVKNWYPLRLLPYEPLPDNSDTELIAVTGTDLYDRSLISRTYATAGLVLSTIISVCCIIAGVVILTISGVSGVIPLMRLGGTELQKSLQVELLSLILNALVTLCTESTGFVHSISLRSALASEGRLHFNTNLRIMTAARGRRNPNGALLNGTMALLLILSYSSSSLIVFVNFSNTESAAITGLPLLVLGVALLLQVVIAFRGIWGVEVLTWSSSPFDVTVALVHDKKLTRFNSRCMCCVSDQGIDACPVKPSKTQPSAWRAHTSIRKVVISLWGVVVACAGWAVLVSFVRISYHSPQISWSFLQPQDVSIWYDMPGADLLVWILLFINIAVIQGPLTMALHCSELIANVIRDESQWRCATEKKGLRPTMNPLKSIFAYPICLILFAVKPFLHWMFGLSITVNTDAMDWTLHGQLQVYMFEAQIWNLCIALFIFACFFTLIALRRPRGPQPAAYGHLQTLANLVDSPLSHVMWWGHKADGPVCHAGTSDHELQEVKMDCDYAGSNIWSAAPISSIFEVIHLSLSTDLHGKI
ncbi:uncharacterized protein HD556DRAFT_1437842 [Suillus plorans]|uniref:Uncharacterized protein n=1 Tax=Suillus plorans TaxID=116603 RepID=A0A9P7DTS8_9AGAM|nr:uncharacterized protein HD556DRAFT_1437842 [Suillus plorans]KAG1802786.1 hypothetical protein HD556DRAFT_1437842 [Suillus plorans]